MKKINRFIFILIILNFLVLILDKYTNYDILLENYFYDFEGKKWIITEVMHNNWMKYIFYSGYKMLVIAFAVVIFICSIFSFTKKTIKYPILKKLRYRFIIVLLSLTFVPLVVSTLKATTNVFCPYELKIYNGKQPYVPIIDKYPKEIKPKSRGRGFPAGHSTSGFALMSLYFLPRKRKLKQIGLGLGIGLGWITGIYQMLRGRHFLSHTIVSMLLGWIIILLVVRAVNITKLKIETKVKKRRSSL